MTVATGLPALAAMAVGIASFVLALLAARIGGARDAGTQRRSPRSLVGFVLQGTGMGYAAYGPLDVTLDPLSGLALIQGLAVAVLMAIVLWLFVASARALGRQWSLVARTRSDHALITSGPFARVRHPIYVALFLLMLALAIAYGHPLHLIFAIPVYVLGTLLRVGDEERLLRQAFGDDYDHYAASVRRFVPRL